MKLRDIDLARRLQALDTPHIAAPLAPRTGQAQPEVDKARSTPSARLNVDLHPDLHHQARLKALGEGRPLSVVVRTLLQEWTTP